MFHNAAECDAYNAGQTRTAKVAALLTALGLDNAVGIATRNAVNEEQFDVTPLPAFLLANADALVGALTVEVPVQRGRKPSTPAPELAAA